MFLLSIGLVVLALVVLGVVAGSALAGPARRLATVRGTAAAEIGDRVRMLTARSAALRVRLDERRARSIGDQTPEKEFSRA